MDVGEMRDQTKTDGSTHLTYTRLCGSPKIETRLRGERFENVMGECPI